MTTNQANLLKDLTTNGQLAIEVSKLIRAEVFTGGEFKEAIKNETPDSFGGSIHFWAMVNMADDSKIDAADAVSKAVIEYVAG